MVRTRRALLLAASALPLAGCGFALRRAPDFGFHSIYLAVPAGSALGIELRRQLQGAGSVEVITEAARRADADVVLESSGEQRERIVVSRTAAGEVREFTLRLLFAFQVRTPAGRELLPPTTIAREIDQSYSESEALSKEQEAQMLYQDLQSDIVQQVIRRLAAIRL